MRKLETFTEKLALLQLSIAGLAVLAILVTISIDVFLRAVFSAPMSATVEIVSFYYMVPMAFFPIAMLEMSDGHIKTDLFYRYFPRGARALSDTVAGVLTMGIYGILAWFSFNQALTSTYKQELAMGLARLPVWPVRWFVPAAFAVGTLAAFLLMVRHITKEAKA